MSNQPSLPQTQAYLKQRMTVKKISVCVCTAVWLKSHQVISCALLMAAHSQLVFWSYLAVLTFFFGTCMSKGHTRATAPHLEYMRPEDMENVSRISLATTLLLNSFIVLDEFVVFLLSSLYVLAVWVSLIVGDHCTQHKEPEEEWCVAFAFQSFKWGGKCFLSTGNASASLL